MKRFDYKVIKRTSLHEVELSILGEEGWELVSTTYIEEDIIFVLIFKKEI